jgi:hypothetical protein
MSGNPLRDLDRAARIHVFGNARRTEAVTTNSFQNPASLRPFLIVVFLLDLLLSPPSFAQELPVTSLFRIEVCPILPNRRRL